MRNNLIILLLLIGGISLHSEPITGLPWSFTHLDASPLPSTSQTQWPQTRLDHFVLARLEKQGLAPAAPAADRTLLRRVYFDLIGLAPTPEQLRSFRQEANRDRPAAIRHVVDELLASPHYGERWARHWLDLARYTDKTASWLNSTAAAWRYRDWVGQAFNRDLPYPDFIKQQLANDLIPDNDPQDNAALGFLGLSPTYWKELQLPPEIIKTTVADEWEERVDALGRTFLGLTLACARCHDHKFEPVSQVDYYAIAGVFASVRIADRPTINEALWLPVAKAREQVDKIEKQLVELKKDKANQTDALAEQVIQLEGKIQAIIKRTPHYHTPMVSGVKEAALYVKPADGRHGSTLEYHNDEARDLALQKRGNPNVLGETIQRQFLGAFPTKSARPRRFERGSGRLDLAEAIVNEAAPLSARVIVNRIWQHHFGRGLVPTPSELGHSGEAPSHPDLINDLAARFVKNSWSIKWLHREILQSSTWQQSGHNPKAIERDPSNRFLARMNQQRLDAEAWRDAILQASGELDLRIGGAPMELAAPDNVRRTCYGTIHRREPNPFLRLHDFPDPTAHAPTRPTTITPLQQLFSLNSPFIRLQSNALATKLLQMPDLGTRIERAYQTLFQRSPREGEQSIALGFFDKDTENLELWSQFAQALLVGNEFQFID